MRCRRRPRELMPAVPGEVRDRIERELRLGRSPVAIVLVADLVLLDPFHVQERGADLTAAEAFAVLATRGVRTILWCAIYDPTESDAWIADAIPSNVPCGWRARLIGDTADGGLAGCGFLTPHLSSESETAASSIVEALARTMSPVRPGLRVD